MTAPIKNTPATPDNKLAYFMKAARIRAGLSQAAVAKKLGFTTPQFISNWERGVSTVPSEHYGTLAKMYKIREGVLKLAIYEHKCAIIKKELGL